MMENFAYIIHRLPTMVKPYFSSSHFRGVTPFKVQVNPDIPFFEGQINADALEKWLNLPEGYYSVQKNFDGENITFPLLKVLPCVRA
jgi:hypothetical protein